MYMLKCDILQCTTYVGKTNTAAAAAAAPQWYILSTIYQAARHVTEAHGDRPISISISIVHCPLALTLSLLSPLVLEAFAALQT